MAMLILRVGIGLTFAAHGYGKIFQGRAHPRHRGLVRQHGDEAGQTARLAGRAHRDGPRACCWPSGSSRRWPRRAWSGSWWWPGGRFTATTVFMIVREGWEYTFVLAVVAIAVATLGAMEWSVDHALGIADDWDGYVGLAIAGGGGVGGWVDAARVVLSPAEVRGKLPSGGRLKRDPAGNHDALRLYETSILDGLGVPWRPSRDRGRQPGGGRPPGGGFPRCSSGGAVCGPAAVGALATGHRSVGDPRRWGHGDARRRCRIRAGVRRDGHGVSRGEGPRLTVWPR